MRFLILCTTLMCLALPASADEIERRVANNGNLVMEDVPEIPADIVAGLNRYQNVRSAAFRGWSADGKSLYVSTRFGDVSQLHRVDQPGGARHQITFYREPIGGVSRRPGTSTLAFTRDAGGSEFAQIFLLNPDGGDAQMLTDGESRNGAMVWDRDGRRLAFQSTRRNGASNDIWIADPDNPDSAEVALESPDGSWWGPAEFSESGSKLLVTNYVSVTDSRVHLVDLDSGETQLLAGGTASQSVNYPFAFDDDNDGFWFITDRTGEFQTLAWQSFEPGSEPVYVTADIPWNVDGGAISDDRRRAVFSVNEGGRTALYLLDPRNRKYRRVDNLPVGLAGGFEFSPDGRKLAMTLNTARRPRADTYVLDLGRDPQDHGASWSRWTYSEVGGLDTNTFPEPDARSKYPTFDEVDGRGTADSCLGLQAARRRTVSGGRLRSTADRKVSRGRSFSSTYQMWLQQTWRRRAFGSERSRLGRATAKPTSRTRQRLSARGLGQGHWRAARLDRNAEPDLDAGTGCCVRRQLRRLHGAGQRGALQRPTARRRWTSWVYRIS